MIPTRPVPRAGGRPVPPRPSPQPSRLAWPASDAARMKATATGMLVVMAVVFVIAKSAEAGGAPWIGYVRAFAEAGLVGGLADWFAVTALFRHPLGLPIPHTAIIPRNKDRIGDTLAVFLRQNFLLPRLIARKMRGVDAAGAAGRFLAAPTGGTDRLRHGASRLIAGALGALDQDRLGGIVKQAAVDRIAAVRVGPLVGQALSAALADGRHGPVLDAAVGWAARALNDNEALIRRIVHDNSNALVRFTGLDVTIADKIVAGLTKLLTAMAAEPDHPLRQRAEAGLAKLAHDLQHDPVMQERAAGWRDQLMENAAVRRWLDGLWERARAALMDAARDPGAMMAGRLGELAAAVGQTLLTDRRINVSVNRFVRRLVVGGVEAYGEGALRLVSDTVRGWDAQTITDRLEGSVGRDLQYIRINGTLVGGLVGVAIHAVGGLL